MLRRLTTRKPVPAQIQIKLNHKSFPAPVKGWVTAENLAGSSKLTAYVMENFRPTLQGIAIRGGGPLYATIDAANTEPVRSLFNFVGGMSTKLFASDATDIFDVTSVVDTTTPPTASVTGQTSGYYSAINFATTGANYLFCCNGSDSTLLYNGTDFHPVSETDLESLAYDAETGTFTEGLIVTGGTSSAIGTIVKLIDDGTTGTLWLNTITGTFQDNEAITDSSTGAATVDGTLTLLASAITGTLTNTFSQVSAHQSRIWFVEKQTMNLHYLPTDAISGVLGDLSLAGTFTKGGYILFTSTWSLDSGSGLDDNFVVVSSEGEVAIFEGTDPSDATLWSLVGVYEILPAMGINATMRAGGDLVVATEGGMMPISEAVNKDPAALSLSAISRAIEPDWLVEVAARRSLPWEIIKWPEKNIAYVSLPVTSSVDEDICYVVNLETGAWAKYTGWNTRCFALHDNQVYFGSNDGTIKKAEVSGWDNVSTPYVCKYAGNWDHLDQIARYKTVKQARSVWKTANGFTAQLSGSVDYTTTFPAAPDAIAAEANDSLWDVGLWDEALWDVGQDFYTVNTRWSSIGKSGFAFSPQIQVTVGGANTPSAELVVFDVTHELGALVV